MNTNELQQFAADARTALMNAIEPRVREALDPNSASHADNTAACKYLEQRAPSRDDTPAFDAYVEELTERYAYRWFNRIIAFRYMDVHGYTVTPVVSSADMTNATALPEILAAARRGEYDERVFGPAIRTNEAIKQHVEAIFNGETTTTDPQSAAYGLLMSAAATIGTRTCRSCSTNPTRLRTRSTECSCRRTSSPMGPHCARQSRS
ncbi:hypothetical protein PG2001B_0957 [Bifidobacterium pseudolongum subsp. globosum]|uniref:Uncharacterized protein n=1 Tax=Bifidobacterium pseudolongum subsp. globosum TaxID=1690 RepID=A0A4Q5AY43_9BIFI|nr:BREX-1 system adenine-specific DNA-methyltransferase PglX [Bifidobacterium pseudolongum]RYQ39643.1 hypothetical protein PG2001B_0957 [Bifidobacterium pseudolongum subsp. globosum]